METAPGLRERKKLRTRAAIVDAAFALFAERGFDGTTIADIAEAADIAPRTFFSYFPSKDDVVFHDFEEQYAMVASWLRDRAPGTNAIDALRDGITGASADADLDEKRLKSSLIRDNLALAAHAEHLKGRFADLLTEAVAQDLGDSPGDLRPRLVGAAAMAAIGVLDELPGDQAQKHAAATIDSLLAFLRGGLAALQEESRS